MRPSGRPFEPFRCQRMQIFDDRLGQWIDLLETAKSESALALLRRYAPEDLGAAKAPWKRWFDENRPYLFFCDSAGFKFFLDVRARQAKAPIKEFRTRKP